MGEQEHLHTAVWEANYYNIFEEFGSSLKSSRYSHHIPRHSTLRYLSREIKAHVSTVWFPELETIEKSISRWIEKLYCTHTMEYLQLFCCCSSFLMVLLFHALSFFSIFVYIAFSQANIWAHNWKDRNNKGWQQYTNKWESILLILNISMLIVGKKNVWNKNYTHSISTISHLKELLLFEFYMIHSYYSILISTVTLLLNYKNH